MRYTLLLLALLLGMSTCTNTDPTQEEMDAEAAIDASSAVPADANQVLLGRWQIKDAYSQGERTAMMDDLYFEYQPSGRLLTNLPGSDNAMYELYGDVIRQRGSSMEPDYKILALSDEELILETAFAGKPFKLYLERYVPEEADVIE